MLTARESHAQQIQSIESPNNRLAKLATERVSLRIAGKTHHRTGLLTRFAAHCWVELLARAIALCSRHAHIRARVYHNASRGSQAGDRSDQPNGHQRTRIRSTNTNTRRRRPAFAFKLFSLWLLLHRLYDPCWFIMGAGSFT